MKFLSGVVLFLAASLCVAEEIPFLKGRATTVRANSRTPVRIDPVEYDFLSGNLDTSKWDEVSTTADKPFGGRPFGSGYAYFEVESREEKPMLLEAKGHSMVYVNGEPRVGDIYSFGYVSLPVQLHKGTNKFLFAVARGSFSGKLKDIAAPLALHVGDMTTPDIIKGEKDKVWIGIPLQNATNTDADDLSIEAGGVTTKVPRVMAMSVRKVGFEVKPNADGKYLVNLKRGGKVLNSVVNFTLRVRDKHESHKRTFVSGIDGSIQYYGVQPSTTDGPGQALFLTLHGASVEGMGQADSYSRKSWGYIIAPTNRRPYGFNWEDIGRLDALEVLELAKKRYQTDPSKMYLTGHSMGGHGTYHLGVLYPDKFAAIAPCSGWISYFSYAGGATYPDTPIGNVLKRAMATSDTLSMKSNYYSKPVYIMHGEVDDNVPVTEARNMRKELADHPMLQWHEEKGQSHWYDTDPEPGASCQDYAPIFDLFAKSRIPAASEVREVNFKTPNLAVSNQSFWIKLLRQPEAGSLSEVKATMYPGLRKFVVEAKNVSSFAVDGSALKGKGPFTVEVGGKAVPTKDIGNGWTRVDLTPVVGSDDQLLLTGFKSVFNNHVTLVLPTGGSESLRTWARSKARYDAEQLWYIGNGSVDVITDTEYIKNEKLYANRNLIVYGDFLGNGLYLMLHGPSRSTVPALGIRFDSMVQNGRLVATISASEEAICKFGDRVPLFTAGASLPDYLTLEKSFLNDGLSGVVNAGFKNDPPDNSINPSTKRSNK